jgi:L-lactate dehydrogenase complex protein LldE
MAATGTTDGEALTGRLPVILFPTCLGDLMSPQTVVDARRVLEACGCDVGTAKGTTCCGQPGFNSGFDDAARRVARPTVRALARTAGPVVVPSGSCGAMMKLHWRELFRGDRDEELARGVSARVVEWSALVAERPLPAFAWRGRVAYHDSCHALRELRVKDAPRKLLHAVDGLEFVDLPSSDRCCGFGGTFAVRYPDVSVAMADSKIADVVAAEVDVLVSGDGGCLLHLGGRLSRVGSPVRTVHLASLLAEALP